MTVNLTNGIRDREPRMLIQDRGIPNPHAAPDGPSLAEARGRFAPAIFGLRELLISKTRSTLIQFLRYTVVGGFAFVVDFAILVLATEYVGIHYLVSAILAFVGGLATNYCLSVMWVFQDRMLRNKAAEFVVFAMIGIVGLALTEAILYVGTSLLGVDYRMSKIVAVILVFLWNFGVRKMALFSRATDNSSVDA